MNHAGRCVRDRMGEMEVFPAKRRFLMHKADTGIFAETFLGL